MTRFALLLSLAALLGASDAAAAGPAPRSPDAKDATQSDAEMVLPPPHGSPKDLATGATRGLGTGVHARAETVTEMGSAEPRTTMRARPRPLTGAPRP